MEPTQNSANISANKCNPPVEKYFKLTSACIDIYKQSSDKILHTHCAK